MADVVFVHGIAQEQHEAIPLEEDWAQRLAGGVDRAGFREIAERLWHGRHGPDGLCCRMAFYGAQFLPEGLQGAGSVAPATEDPFAEDLARAWLEHAAGRASSAAVRREARRQLDAADADPGDAQGAGLLAGGCIRRLSRIPWFGELGYRAATVASRSVGQVARYFADDAVRRYATRQVLDLIDDRTRVLVAHSLGSIVAYEAAHQLRAPLPLLVTLGSPLGIEPIRRRLACRGYPVMVARWVNVMDHDDFVAAEPQLDRWFAHGKPPEATFEPVVTVDNGAKPHRAGFYLTKAAVGRPVAEALTQHGSR